MSKFSMQNDSLVEKISSLSSETMIGRILCTAQNKDFIIQEIGRAFARVCATLDEISSYAEDFFFDYVPSIPKGLLNQAGSTKVGGLAPLYLFVRCVEPDVIVESGVFIGASLHMMRAAAPRSDIFAFDISFRPLTIRDDSIFYHEDDWITFDNLPDGGIRLAYFDDHISCGKRIIESHERRFNFLAFDDSPSLGTLRQYRYPALPSIPFIMNKQLSDNTTFEWTHESTSSALKYTYDAASVEYARAKISSYAPLDVLAPTIGYSAGDKWAVTLTQGLANK